MEPRDRCTAFAAGTRIASGTRAEVARALKVRPDRSGDRVLVVDDATSQVVELDLRGSAEDVDKRYAAKGGEPPEDAAPGSVPRSLRGPGRPKLGVIGREVTLLPRHWAWLNAQRGGASATLRRLVDQARRESSVADQVRVAQDATYRFMLATVGDHPGFEEATRALYALNAERFESEARQWPSDLFDHARRLAAPVFAPSPADQP